MTELGFRSRKILFATITEYISSGEPVGSRTLSRRFELNLSAATIRNVLSDLEEAGYLAQPHTSAGRIPTDKGFRVFVDALAQQREVTADDREAIIHKLRSLRPGVDDLVRETGRLLSALTGAAAVVLPPPPEAALLAQLRFVPLREGELLAVIVTRSGGVQNRVVRVGRELEAGELDRVHNYLAEMIRDRTLHQLRQAVAEEMTTERDRHDLLRRRAKEMLDAMPSASERPEVVIEGQGLLLDHPEFAHVEKIRTIIHTLEEKEKILELLDRTLASGGVQVLIGSETELGEVQDLSVISASYRQAGASTGTLGVIGPTRMDYGKVVPLVGFTAQVMTDLLDGPDADDRAADRD